MSDITIPNRPLGPHLVITDAIRLGRWHETQIVGNGFDSGRPLGSDADVAAWHAETGPPSELGLARGDNVPATDDDSADLLDDVLDEMLENKKI